MGDLHAVFDRGGKLHRVLAKPAIAGDGDHFAPAKLFEVLRRRPCAHGGGKAEADGAQIARHQDALALLGLKVTAEGISVVAHIHGDHRIVRRVAGEHVEQHGR